MIIAKAQIAMATSHDYREEHQINESLTFWLNPKASKTTIEQAKADLHWTERVDISSQGLSLLRNRQSLDLNTQMDSRSRINLAVLKHLYEAITGRPMQIMDPAELQNHDSLPQLEVDVAQTPDSSPKPPPTAGYGMVYQREEHYQEQEKMEFKAEGVIQTEDGRSIKFSSSLTMSRHYVEDSSLTIRGGDAKKIDPLVINFDGKGAQLSQTRFKFDLDSDGSEEQLAVLRPGSGFLAFDRNGDGTINDGSELFGPRSGQGFAELEQFDEDGNHFIDEGDSIYNKLRIWSVNEDGTQQLAALGDKKIGAIFLGHVTTPFQLKDSANQSLGEVVSSGVYISEDGSTGVIQQINLTA